MKIISLETHVVAVPPPHVGGMYWIFVTLKTDCGIEGVGEVYAASFHPAVMVPAINDVFERYLFNHDPHQVERFFRECYSSGFTQRPDLTMMGITSGLEMACWDIIGKAANQPVYQLIGGKVNEHLRSYTYLYPENAHGQYDYDDPDLAAECAAQYMQQGFTALKFDPAGPYTVYSGHHLSLEVMDQCELFCRRIREAVGSKCDLLFGTHGQMTPASAIRLAKRLEKYDPLWFEEPVPPGQADAMAQVAGKTSIQLATATPNFLIQESIMTWDGFHSQVLKQPIRWEDGFIIPPTEPGLGVELNMDVVRAHSPYVGERLHLLMDPRPFDVRTQSSDAWKNRWNTDKSL